MLIQADARRIPLADGSCHMVCTSPPYWSLRDYQLPPSIFGGDAECEHVWEGEEIHEHRESVEHGKTRTTDRFYGDASRRFNGNHQKHSSNVFCALCGAWRGCLGLEPTPELYVAHMVEVFREVKRVLRNDGVVFINLGDCYYSQGERKHGDWAASGTCPQEGIYAGNLAKHSVLKPKDLVGIPWRVAFALQADGWWLRDAIVWAKGWVDDEDVNEGSVMPGSQQDRCTSAYEMVFMLTKSARYYFDIDGQRTTSGATMRNVWRINTASFKGAHFATFAPKLAERCILLGASAKGACPECGAPWERVTELTPEYKALLESGTAWRDQSGKPDSFTNRQQKGHASNVPQKNITTGWRPTCDCFADINPDQLDWNIQMGLLEYAPVPCLVLDPFCGSGTTGMVAIKHGREFVGLDLNGEYLHDLATERLSKIQKVLL